MTIYEHKRVPSPARGRIAPVEKNLTDRVECVAVDVPAGAHNSPAFLAKNPTGTVPVLAHDDGALIPECSAVTEAIDVRDGQPTLTGRTPRDRPVSHRVQRRAEAGLLDAVGARFHHATPGLGPKIGACQNPAWGAPSRDRAQAGLRDLDGLSSARPSLAGDAFSMADITAFADFAGVTVPSGRADLAAWRARGGDRPSIAQA